MNDWFFTATLKDESGQPKTSKVKVAPTTYWAVKWVTEHLDELHESVGSILICSPTRYFDAQVEGRVRIDWQTRSVRWDDDRSFVIA